VLKFTRAERYVNMARINPDLLVEGNTIKFTDSNSIAIGIMALVVKESHIRIPTNSNVGNPIYRLTGLPFAQEWRRDISVWGMKLRFDNCDITGPVSSSGISFQTRPAKNQSGQIRKYIFFI
jgi:hypothetical protein